MSNKISFRFKGEILFEESSLSDIADFLKKAKINVIAKDDNKGGRLVEIDILESEG